MQRRLIAALAATSMLLAGCAGTSIAPPGATPTQPGATLTATPAASETPGPTPSSSPTPDPTAASPDVPGDDPPDLPRMPGSVRTHHARGMDDGLQETSIEYQATADIGLVRGHYRRVLREHGWRLGEIEFDDGDWELDASKGAREVELEIERSGGGTRIEVTITEPGPA